MAFPMTTPAEETRTREIIATALRAFVDRDDAGLARLVHPRGRFLIRSAEEPVVGRAGMRRYMLDTRRRVVEPTISTWIDIEPGVCVLGGRLQFQHGQNIRDGEIAWRIEVRDGMMWRVTSYDNVEEALADGSAR
jgi:hypothetical protein